MRSSDVRTIICRAPFTVATLALLSAACSGGAPRTETTAADAPACAGQPPETSGELARTAAEVRRAAESGPLFAQLAAAAPSPSCRMSTESGRIVLEYAFGTVGNLRVTSDPRIEYSDQEARLAAPIPMDQAVELLQRVERASFSDGCGVNWSQPDTSNQAEREATRETVFRGGTCNCRARVTRGPDGRAIGLSFRSAC
jgi:hypothetical protein